MKRGIKAVLLFCLTICLSACLNSKEHISINTDGTGTLNVNLQVPQGTMVLFDQMMGGFMQQMAQAMPQGEAAPPMPKSIAEEMFGNKEVILKKAQETGINIEFENFSSEKQDGALVVNYKLKFDDIFKLSKSGVVMTNFEIEKSGSDEWKLVLREDNNKAKETKAQMEQLTQPDLDKLSPQERMVFEHMQTAMKDFHLEFKVSMPLAITNTVGMFKRLDDNTAGLEISGNLLDPEFYQKMEEMSGQDSIIIWGGDGLTQQEQTAGINSTEIPTEFQNTVETNASGKEAQIFLNNGEQVIGKIIEENEDFIIIKVAGVDVKYYKDEIERVE